MTDKIEAVSFSLPYYSLENINASNIDTITHIDLTGQNYHGGTSYSSGVLPKWDILGGSYMIKRCSFDSYGNALTDALNEELIYKFCEATDIHCAKYRTITIKYFDNEAHEVVQCPATLTKMFRGELEHYVAVRRTSDFGRSNDELIDFAEAYKVQPQFNDMLFVDFLFNQQDRHAKNFGIVKEHLSPLFDSGACLNFDIPDNLLENIALDEITKFKAFSKDYRYMLDFSLRYVYNGFSFKFDEPMIQVRFAEVLKDFSAMYSRQRYSFIERLVSRRLDCVEEILFNVGR